MVYIFPVPFLCGEVVLSCSILEVWLAEPATIVWRTLGSTASTPGHFTSCWLTIHDCPGRVVSHMAPRCIKKPFEFPTHRPYGSKCLHVSPTVSVMNHAESSGSHFSCWKTRMSFFLSCLCGYDWESPLGGRKLTLKMMDLSVYPVNKLDKL
jgi:hypothetical protein